MEQGIDQWAKQKWLFRLSLSVFIVFAICFFINWNDWTSTIILIIFFLLFLILGVITTSTKLFFICPNCKQTFFLVNNSFRPFATRCVHCDFPKWEKNAANFAKK